ncbi:hypothetical protein [Clostridium botulinum B1 str. Okra] [Clostridioides difficile]|nr:hypothetical protein [Clostridium botulinum B1 str. Okra] [Clostridioides difficile]
MDIKPYDKTIRELFLSGRQFVIPRFQREYSWDKKNYQEFFEDMINNLSIKESKIVSNQYFLGTMLFVGNFAEGTDQEIQVVDGQQRLTTITILFSALSDRFILMKEDTLSEQIFKYIMTKDDNGEEVRILKSKSHYPYFAYFIQDRKKEICQEPNSEEEICIKETYDYMFRELSEERLKTLLKKKHGSDIVKQLRYIDILKAIRDQVLNPTFVSISTKDREQANKIFEILNAKGKRLAHIDLIKNKIFDILKQTEPADFAEDYWCKIKNILNKGKDTVGLATYYRHFWISAYKKSSSSKLYDDFNILIMPKNDDRYKKFLKEMLENVENYVKIINPNREDYNNRKEYFWLVQSLNALSNYFNIVQVRIVLLALYDLRDKKIIDHKLFKSTIIFLENFHFSYNAIVSGRSNSFESIYSSFAIALRRCTTKAEAIEIINQKLINRVNKLFPSFEQFSKKFIKLTYSKKENNSNIKVKYILNKLNCHYMEQEIFADDSSVEHILPESDGQVNLNIGNLILLERSLNSEADQKNYQEKINIYSKSKYTWVEEFINQHRTWEESMINERALQMSKEYYTKILGRRLE